MPPLHRSNLRVRLRFAAGLLVASTLAAALPPPSEWKLPPLDGQLSGELNALVLGGAPKVKWSLEVRTERPRERVVTYSANGYGLRVQAGARVDPMGEGTWRLHELEANLGEWFGWLAPHLVPKLSAVAVSGTLQASGEGTWRDGKFGGRAVVTLRDGRIDDIGRKVLFDGLAFSITLEDLATPRTAPAQVVTWTSGRYDVVELGPGRIEFTLDGDKVNIASASIAVFGGELAVRQVAFSTERPEFSASAQMTGVDVGKLVFLMPKVVAWAKGRLDGYLDLHRDREGIVVSGGYLGLREGETAQIHFRPSPGIISSSLPPRINELYPGLREMESGGIPMLADVLQLTFMPAGDEQGRTALIRLAGRPADPAFQGPVDLTVNVRGPLDQVINTSANSALRLMGR